MQVRAIARQLVHSHEFRQQEFAKSGGQTLQEAPRASRRGLER